MIKNATMTLIKQAPKRDLDLHNIYIYFGSNVVCYIHILYIYNYYIWLENRLKVKPSALLEFSFPSSFFLFLQFWRNGIFVSFYLAAYHISNRGLPPLHPPLLTLLGAN